MARAERTAPRHRGQGGARRCRWDAALALVAVWVAVVSGGRLVGLDIGLDAEDETPVGSESQKGGTWTSPHDTPTTAMAGEASGSDATAVRPVRPARVSIPRLQVEVPVVPIALETSTLVPPDDPQVLGWWSEGARPGAATGTALVTGHTVHGGGGALDHLEDIRPGDTITIQGARRSVEMRVTLVRTLDKGQLAQRASRLFSQSGPGRLALVTCEDWNGASYDSNVVVFASPT